ncbi:MAG: class I SAM-dependent methyltransferase [Bacteroidia bacterium]
MTKTITYHFHDIALCNMCRAAKEFQKVLGKRLNHSQGKKPSRLSGITVSVVQCKNCGLIFSNPQPIPEKMSDHYGTPPEQYWSSENYFEDNPNYFLYELKQFTSIMPITKGMKALDIGAGLGKCMIALNRAGFDSWGFEPSEPFYSRAISKMNILPERLKLSSVEDAQYENNFFDFITFGAVLEHLYDPSESIKKAMTWLKPGGLMHIEVPSSKWLINRIANIYYKIAFTDYVANISPMHNPFHLYEFSLKSFEENAKVNNYKIAQHFYYVASTYMPKVIDKLLYKVMESNNTGMQLCVWLKKS